jgi:hypothetical protein
MDHHNSESKYLEKNKELEIDDSFQLYDLRVEVICPPGERIMCGAKIGDHFLLQGEMLSLPPGQGFSIYSLGKVVTSIHDLKFHRVQVKLILPLPFFYMI